MNTFEIMYDDQTFTYEDLFDCYFFSEAELNEIANQDADQDYEELYEIIDDEFNQALAWNKNEFKWVLYEMGDNELFCSAKLQSYDDDRNDDNINWITCHCDHCEYYNGCNPLDSLKRTVDRLKYYTHINKYTKEFASFKSIIHDMCHLSGKFLQKVRKNYIDDHNENNINWNTYYNGINDIESWIRSYEWHRKVSIKQKLIKAMINFIPKHTHKQKNYNVLDQIKYHPSFMNARIYEFEDTEQFFEIMGY